MVFLTELLEYQHGAPPPHLRSVHKIKSTIANSNFDDFHINAQKEPFNGSKFVKMLLCLFFQVIM